MDGYHISVMHTNTLCFNKRFSSVNMIHILDQANVPSTQVSPCLSVLSRLLFSSDPDVLADACWALSYLSDGPNDKIQTVIDSGVCRRLVELLM